jgi:hypothetical protein
MRSRISSPVADELCVIKSMTTDQFNHAPAELLLFTGSPRQGRPSMGSWVTYGLGRQRESARVRRADQQRHPAQRGPGGLGHGISAVGFPRRAMPVARATRCSTSAILPASTAPCVATPSMRCAISTNFRPASSATRRRDAHLAVRARVPHAGQRAGGDGYFAGTGVGARGLRGPARSRPAFANNCLLGRRLLEQGVRFVQLFDWGWDFHGTAARGYPRRPDAEDGGAPTGRWPRSSATSASAVCSTIRSSSGAANSAARRSAKVALRPATSSGAIISPTRSPSSSPAVA